MHFPRLRSRQAALIEAADDGDAGLAEDVCDLGFAEAGSVVFEGNVKFGFIELEAAEAVGVGEFAERAELVVSERRLEFEFGLEERHGEIIAKGDGEKDGAGFRAEDSALALGIEERSPTARSRTPYIGSI